MFSPYYAWSRRFGAGDPERHCTLNVALYGKPRRWAMTERTSATRTADTLSIGPSTLHWNGTTLTIQIAERTLPTFGRLRGEIRVHPEALTGAAYPLDAAGHHIWTPLAPRAHVEVALENPALHWSGPGYLDSNHGDSPLEDAFSDWTWSRADLGDRTAILYEVTARTAPGANLALAIDRTGAITPFEPPPPALLPRTKWRVPRTTRADQGQANILETLEDTPFYARSVLRTNLCGQPVTAMHESLSLNRFRTPIVQAMLPFRMPRAREPSDGRTGCDQTCRSSSAAA